MNTARLASGLKPEYGMPRKPTTYSPPATLASASAKATSLARTGSMENEAAPRLLSRAEFLRHLPLARDIRIS
jgi:hypothetical protein